MKASLGVFSNGRLIPLEWSVGELRGEEGEPLPVREFEVPAQNWGDFSQPSTKIMKYFEVPADGNVYILQKVKSVSEYKRIEPSKVLPSTISEEEFERLALGFKARYEQVIEVKEVLEKVELETVLETEESIEEWFSCKSSIPGVFVEFDALGRRIRVKNFRNILEGEIEKLRIVGTKVLYTGGQVNYLETPWDGAHKKILSRKRNGRPYADNRGNMVPDFVAIDSLKLPDIPRIYDVLQFSSLAQFHETLARMVEIIANPGVPAEGAK